MGADIHGWVEFRKSGDEWWEAIIRIDELVYRSYANFASLFGVRNGGYREATAIGRFRAIAPGRGAPPHASAIYRVERGEYGVAVGETWALWTELAEIDWDEEGEQYVGDDDFAYSEPGPGRQRERRGDYLNGGWATLFKLMAVLAEQFGPENARLSVWFDQW